MMSFMLLRMVKSLLQQWLMLRLLQIGNAVTIITVTRNENVVKIGVVVVTNDDAVTVVAVA